VSSTSVSEAVATGTTAPSTDPVARFQQRVQADRGIDALQRRLAAIERIVTPPRRCATARRRVRWLPTWVVVGD
jgi:hypothetical protein